MYLHMVPVIGPERVVGIGNAPKHAQQRRLVRSFGQHFVVACERIRELRNFEAPVHYV